MNDVFSPSVPREFLITLPSSAKKEFSFIDLLDKGIQFLCIATWVGEFMTELSPFFCDKIPYKTEKRSDQRLENWSNSRVDKIPIAKQNGVLYFCFQTFWSHRNWYKTGIEYRECLAIPNKYRILDVNTRGLKFVTFITFIFIYDSRIQWVTFLQLDPLEIEDNWVDDIRPSDRNASTTNDYTFFVLGVRTWEKFNLQTYCACLVQKNSYTNTPIWRSVKKFVKKKKILNKEDCKEVQKLTFGSLAVCQSQQLITVAPTKA